MKCAVWWLVLACSLARATSEAMLKEGDSYSLECSSPGWKYCSWRHKVSRERMMGMMIMIVMMIHLQSYECDRTSSSPVEWCNRSLGLRWSQGESCGLDLVSLRLEQAGLWEATLLQGPHLNLSHHCQHQPQVAAPARLSLLSPSRHLAGRTELVTCLSQGGRPQPLLQAFISRGDQQRRPLQVRPD